MNNQNMYSKSTNGIFVILAVTRNIVENFPFMNRILTKVLEIRVRVNKSTTGDMSQLIKKEYPILKLKDMPDKEMPKETIPLRNGKNSKRNVAIDVPSVGNARNLLKTISFHYRREARITF